MDKLVLEFPTLDELKHKLEDGLPDEIEVTFKNKEDNIKEFEIIFYLVNEVDYFFDKLKPIDNSHTIYLGYFKRKS